MSQLSVDTAHHVITDIRAYHADKKDNQYLQDISIRLKKRLHKQGLIWRNCVADTGYSSGGLTTKSRTFFLRPMLHLLIY